MVYRSKIDFFIFIPILITAAFGITEWLTSNSTTGTWIFIGIVLFTISFFNTSYTITNNHQLKIKCSFIVNYQIDISAINRIEKTSNFLSSPALSLDRIEIFYGKYDSVIISPKHKHHFAAQLKAINPSIDIQKV